jgi:diadenosine tetraphosphate (Ap4A) HIT family hydrolase
VAARLNAGVGRASDRKRYPLDAQPFGYDARHHRQTTSDGERMTTLHCESCTRLIRRDQGTAPLWDAIYRTTFWDVVHSYNTSLPGWLVLVARRHIEAIAELTPAEAAELGLLLQRVSRALHATTGCLKTYVIQFAEAAEHPHVHVHIVPRMADHPPERRGPQVFAYLGVTDQERLDDGTMNELAQRIQTRLIADETVP